ncbi:MAG: tryptophan halogenase family protein [Myxococcaceae bacterium]
MQGPVRSVCVVGGGTAGLFAALFLRRRFPALSVTLLESPTVPIIGVGEATTTLMPPFLHLELGLDVEALFREVRPTWKLGITFEWGPADDFFTYPFGPADPVEALLHDGTLRTQSLTSRLMGAHRAPLVREPDGSVRSMLGELKFAYHLHNAPFVDFLLRHALERGVTHVRADVTRVETGPRGVEALHLHDGRRVAFDLFVDASGFKSLLLGEALGVPFTDWSSSLFCDRALVTNVPHGGLVRAATTAETMNAGWCWRIPVEADDHRGYVFSSRFLGDEGALAEFAAANPAWPRETPVQWVRFRSGRHHDFWRGNVVALGNAFAFVEPLESTALHMVLFALDALGDGLARLGRGEDARVAAHNAELGAHWDALRWFLAAHYRFNERRDSPFWKEARARVELGPVQGAVERLAKEGPWLEQHGRRFAPDDPTFGHAGLMMVLLGQRVSAAPPKLPLLSRAAWQQRAAKEEALVARALSVTEALAWLREHPGALHDSVVQGWMRAEQLRG